jgi:O-6-methylguanine DNA methyltransferase
MGSAFFCRLIFLNQISNSMVHAFLNTPLGDMLAVFCEKGLRALMFSDDHAKSLCHWQDKGLHDKLSLQELKVLSQLQEELDDYFSGKFNVFSVPLNLSGTAFQLNVWKVLIEIPYGETRSYTWVAEQLGNRKLIRAAASANGKNPVSILVPCHRVIGSDGSLTGYAAGLHRKKWLLEHETKHNALSGSKTRQLSLF